MIVKNTSNLKLNINDLHPRIVIKPGDVVNLLDFYTEGQLKNSNVLKDFLDKGFLIEIEKLPPPSKEFIFDDAYYLVNNSGFELEISDIPSKRIFLGLGDTVQIDRSDYLKSETIKRLVARKVLQLERGTVQQPLFKQPSPIPLTADPSIYVSIIIPVYNQLELTKKCIDSIRKYTNSNYELIVVDNGSTDETLSWLTEQNVIVIHNKTNKGYAAACNQGIKRANGEYFLLLNNDTEVLKSGWLTPLICTFKENPRIGLVGAVGGVLDSNYDFVKEVSRDTHFVDYVPGWCFMISRKAFYRIGKLDEKYGYGLFEDTDYSLRAKLKGLKIAVAPGVSIVHHYHKTLLAQGEFDVKKLMYKNRSYIKSKFGLTYNREKFCVGGERILVIRLAALGDVLVTTPTLKSLRKKYPTSNITFLTYDMCSNMIFDNYDIDEVYACPYVPLNRQTETVRDLNQRNFDILINLQDNIEGAWFATKINAKQKFGNQYFNGLVKADNNSIFMRDALESRRLRANAKLSHAQVFAKIAHVVPSSFDLTLNTRYIDKLNASKILQSIPPSKKIIGCHFRSHWKTRVWPLRYVKQLVDKLKEKFYIIIVGAPVERPLYENLEDTNVMLSFHNSIKLQAEIIKGCDLFFSINSAPAHIAAAMGVSTLTMFSVIDPVEALSPGENHHFITVDKKCAPCFKMNCKEMCLMTITPQMAYNRIVGIFESQSKD